MSVHYGFKINSYSTKPILFLISFKDFISLLFMKYLPECLNVYKGDALYAKKFSNVVFPDPECPINPTN